LEKIFEQDGGTVICGRNGALWVPVSASKLAHSEIGDDLKFYCRNFNEIVGVEIVGKFKFIHSEKSLKADYERRRGARLAWLSNHGSPILRSLAAEMKTW